MANVSGPIDDAVGPAIEMRIGVDEARQEVLRLQGFAVPEPVAVYALIDTGAALSAVDPRILKQLKLMSIGTTSIHTPSTGPTPHECNECVVSILLEHREESLRHASFAVIESEFHPDECIAALVGRDFLSKCAFLYDGPKHAFSLSF